MNTRDAYNHAQSLGLDLVEISPTANPPVCKITDYSKYIYEIEKKQKAAKKKQRENRVDVKEVNFRPTTEENDFQVKLHNIERMLEDGNKVKIGIKFQGREITHSDIGTEMMENIKTHLAEKANVESDIKMFGKQMIMILAPKKR